MRTFLLEWFRTDQHEPFELGGVAAEGGRTRYRDTSTSGKPAEVMEQKGQDFQRDIDYFEQWYVNDRDMTWRECFIRMSQHGIVGYFVWRVAIDLPEEAELDDVFDFYMVKGRTDEFKPPRERKSDGSDRQANPGRADPGAEGGAEAGAAAEGAGPGVGDRRPYIGYRWWRVGHDSTNAFTTADPHPYWRYDTRPVLKSLMIPGFTWDPGWNVAECRIGLRPHECPPGRFLKCRCGFYADARSHAGRPVSVRPVFGHRQPIEMALVCGVVLLAGSVAVHELGFRASHAKVLALADSSFGHADADDVRGVLEVYGVPSLPWELLGEYGEWFGRHR